MGMIDIKPLKITPRKPKIIPINPKLKVIVDEFLSSDFYMKEFDKLTKHKKFETKEQRRFYLLKIHKGEIGFRYPVLNVLFARWQLYIMLKDKEGYSKVLNGPVKEAKEFLALIQPE